MDNNSILGVGLSPRRESKSNEHDQLSEPFREGQADMSVENDIDETEEFSSRVSGRLRAALGIVGGVAIVAGLAALVLPHATLFAVAWVFGTYLFVSGAVMIVRAFSSSPRAWWRRIGLIVLGLLVIAGGVVAILLPPIGVRWVALLIGFSWILEGISLLYAPAQGHRALTVILAVLSVLSGILVINLPYLGAVLTVAAVGSVLIIFGVVQLISAFAWTRFGSGEPDVTVAANR
ncbi:DUF308 domain-containing protein [Curtobacterium sp. MCSS17_005]|uniref:HdeD family acid-resistance protein n=1 Tax=Curtobacterium sp. MCSS17_005 TaxID=2175641 RepID=UPI0011B76FA7|nr:DUF308 domain-containing protein [Curtobacterium sp. MCSS17_005]WIB34365.1 DUF308 domain-containing protein [Curtobacterium sp. MCSS17_005]